MIFQNVDLWGGHFFDYIYFYVWLVSHIFLGHLQLFKKILRPFLGTKIEQIQFSAQEALNSVLQKQAQNNAKKWNLKWMNHWQVVASQCFFTLVNYFWHLLIGILSKKKISFARYWHGVGFFKLPCPRRARRIYHSLGERWWWCFWCCSRPCRSARGWFRFQLRRKTPESLMHCLPLSERRCGFV